MGYNRMAYGYRVVSMQEGKYYSIRMKASLEGGRILAIGNLIS